jgi:glycosyltransferase involved in cell wall biosynthesis
VVCADASGLTELIDHGVNGLKARVGDPGDLATQIARLVDDPALSARCGVEARRYVLEHHDPQRVAAKAIALYKRAIEHAKPRNGVRSSVSSAGMT